MPLKNKTLSLKDNSSSNKPIQKSQTQDPPQIKEKKPMFGSKGKTLLRPRSSSSQNPKEEENPQKKPIVTQSDMDLIVEQNRL